MFCIFHKLIAFFFSQRAVEGDCSFVGNKVLEQPEILDPEECFLLSEELSGKYYVHDANLQVCTVYDSNQRKCMVERSLNGLANCPPEI